HRLTLLIRAAACRTLSDLESDIRNETEKWILKRDYGEDDTKYLSAKTRVMYRCEIMKILEVCNIRQLVTIRSTARGQAHDLLVRTHRISLGNDETPHVMNEMLHPISRILETDPTTNSSSTGQARSPQNGSIQCDFLNEAHRRLADSSGSCGNTSGEIPRTIDNNLAPNNGSSAYHSIDHLLGGVTIPHPEDWLRYFRWCLEQTMVNADQNKSDLTWPTGVKSRDLACSPTPSAALQCQNKFQSSGVQNQFVGVECEKNNMGPALYQRRAEYITNPFQDRFLQQSGMQNQVPTLPHHLQVASLLVQRQPSPSTVYQVHNLQDSSISPTRRLPTPLYLTKTAGDESMAPSQCSYPKSVRLKSLLKSEEFTQDNKELNEICEFARYFKLRRLTLGLTQTQVGSALNAKEGPAYSQSAICRFEKLDVTAKSARRMKPVLERWLAETEAQRNNGNKYYDLQLSAQSSRKRKRRTCFSPQALCYLVDQLRKNPYPSKSEMSELSQKLTYDREVIRVWFCNRRQALKSEGNSFSSSSSEPSQHHRFDGMTIPMDSESFVGEQVQSCINPENNFATQWPTVTE
ncbi:Pou domain - to homeobox domain protein, partial [Opisthorchis viverrini]